MYVKSLTLKGFKSFASATTLRLEPGITCIVGPNGSGKSNVVDALAWVMGEQGAKSLRGGKMEDVIFAGTSGRAPLGRAEVALTIDNTDGALPIDYTEVTIARTMFRNGGSEYSINGTACRLLDVQELLSDSGIGREMHVIVGQGQLDAVLRATPEERRGFIEEAAGVLKHRKRKEKALRKLETMEANLTRVHDLTGEIRRQLGPLGRQAETARKAAVIQADARDARLRLLADDLVQLAATLEQEVADETALIERRTEVEEALTELGDRLPPARGRRRAGPPGAVERPGRVGPARAPRRADGGDPVARRRAACASSARTTQATRIRRAPATPTSCGPSPPSCASRQELLLAEVDEVRATLEATVAGPRRGRARPARTRSPASPGSPARPPTGARDWPSSAGQVAARASRIEAREAEIGRLRATAEQGLARAAAAERDFARLETSVADDEEGEHGLDDAYEEAAAELEAAEAEVAEWRDAGAAADRDRATAAARRRGPRAQPEPQGRRRRAARRCRRRPTASSDRWPPLVTVEPGLENAVAAALGSAAEALAVELPRCRRCRARHPARRGRRPRRACSSPTARWPVGPCRLAAPARRRRAGPATS